jgi:hypothetical protein
MPAPANAATWQDDMMRLNATLGMTLQGDMDLVAVDASKVQALGLAPEDYLNAVKADSQAAHGKNALPKNAILVVLGIDPTGTQVAWARSTTGMPIGNNEMNDYIANRFTIKPLAAFTPDIILGKATASVTKVGGKYVVKHQVGTGVIAQAVMVDQPFARACMKCSSENDKQQAAKTGQAQVGFVALQDLIPISTAGIVWAILAMFGITLLLYGAGIGIYVLLTGAMVYPYWRRQSYSMYNRSYPRSRIYS